METNSSRVAQVFVWKHGTAPDVDYARQVLSVVNADAYKALLGDNPPLQLFSVMDGWPDDPWARALRDMRALPAPNGTQWTDTTRYDLSGWQGTDTRTGDKIFIVIAYAKAAGLSAETFRGEGVQAPPYIPPPAPQVPYYPQYPTGPLVWPQQPQQPQQPAQYPYPQYGPPYQQPPAQSGYPYGYNPLLTAPLAPMHTSVLSPLQVAGMQQEAAQPNRPDSYAPFYVGFGPRLASTLIDFFFMSGFFAASIGIGWLLRDWYAGPGSFWDWLNSYSAWYIGVGLLIFVVYHLVGWSTSGRTWGKKLMGIKVVGPGGEAPGFGRALIRILGYLFSASIAGAGFWLLIPLDSRRQGLHDKIAETYVVPDKPTVPAPAGLPGYRTVVGTLQAPSQAAAYPMLPGTVAVPPVGMAAVAGTEPYGVVKVATPTPEAPAVAQPQAQPTPQETERPANGSGVPAPPTPTASAPPVQEQAISPPPEEISEPYIGTLPNGPLGSGPLGQSTEAVLAQAAREYPERTGDVERARALYKMGMSQLENGVRRGYSGMEVEPSAARAAADYFRDALELVPSSVPYKYFYAVALRYSEGFEVAIGEFRQLLELDPGHFEARQQVAFGPRWHDAFAYPTWGEHTVEATMALPEPVRILLPPPQRPGTRLAMLREGSNKLVVALSRTRRDTWSEIPTTDMPARIELVLSRTPSGPIIAFYVVIRDDPDNPYKGETFLNPHDPGQPSDDACLLGQHMMAQLARQDHTYLVFVDENDNLLLSRKLLFDTPTQVNIARVHYEAQSLPPQAMDLGRFQQAAQWHMEHFSLDQIKA